MTPGSDDRSGQFDAATPGSPSFLEFDEGAWPDWGNDTVVHRFDTFALDDAGAQASADLSASALPSSEPSSDPVETASNVDRSDPLEKSDPLDQSDPLESSDAALVEDAGSSGRDTLSAMAQFEAREFDTSDSKPASVLASVYPAIDEAPWRQSAEPEPETEADELAGSADLGSPYGLALPALAFDSGAAFVSSDSFFDRTLYETGVIDLAGAQFGEQPAVVTASAHQAPGYEVGSADPGLPEVAPYRLPGFGPADSADSPAGSADSPAGAAEPLTGIGAEYAAYFATQVADDRLAQQLPAADSLVVDEPDSGLAAASAAAAANAQFFGEPSPRSVDSASASGSGSAGSYLPHDPDMATSGVGYPVFQPNRPVTEQLGDPMDDRPYIEPPFVKGDREGRPPGGGPPRRVPSRGRRYVVPIGLGVVSTFALLAGWSHVQEGAGTSPGTVAESSSPQASSSPTPKPSESSASKPSEGASATPSASPTKSAVIAIVPDRSVDVVVLNGTNRKGLAAKVAASLSAKGWHVVTVGNGAKATRTTIFSPGPKTATATMRKDLPSAGATAKPASGMPTSQITVVIGSDYPK